MARRWFPRDFQTTIQGTATAYTANQTPINAAIIDLGSGRCDFSVIAEVTALDISSTDESYDLIVQGSNSSTFASGIEELARYRLGATATRAGAQSSVVGRYEIDCSNESPVNGTTEYRYCRVLLVVAGTTPSITLGMWITRDSNC